MGKKDRIKLVCTAFPVSFQERVLKQKTVVFFFFFGAVLGSQQNREDGIEIFPYASSLPHYPHPHQTGTLLQLMILR